MIAYTINDKDIITKGLESLPYLNVSRSTLGGDDKASILISISLDKKETWKNGIYQNSRYRQFHMYDGKIESISGYGCEKFRKASVKDANDAVDKIIKWVQKNPT
jgi:hypothetical protein